jgi:hypothetical protein
LKRLLKNLLMLLVILTGADMLLGGLLDVLLDHAPDGRYQKARYTLEQCREDIVIVGSSRGESNYVPQIFEDSLNSTCWNASRGGQGMPFFRCMQEGILARYAPRLVILNLEPMILQDEMGVMYEYAGLLRPFYSSHAEIRPVLNRISPHEKWLLKSRLYSYNSSYYYLLRPYFFKGLDGKHSDKGWKPRDKNIDGRLVKKVEDLTYDSPLDPEEVAEFELLVKKFQDSGSQIIMVVSPDYARHVETSTTLTYLRNFSKKQRIPLLIFSDDTSMASNAGYFADPDHLNETGAVFFSKMLSHRIKRMMSAATLGFTE